jgi:multiple sugar transport system substrate-binding protein
MRSSPAGRRRRRPYEAGLAALTLFLAACGPAPAPQGGPAVVSAWFHTGRDAERRTIQAQVERFHEAQSAARIDLTLIPEGGYDIQVQSAALSGGLPCVLDFDGPMLYKYVWQRHLRPLDDLLPQEVLATLIPSILEQGTYRGRLYSVGTFDSGLGLYGDRAQLARAGARIPKGPEDAWTAEELDALLARLAAEDRDGKVLDLALHYRGEWITYAFSPILQSAGADLIDRSTYRTASGVLDSPAAVAALERVQGWFERGWVHPNVDESAFQNREVALSWGGHWRWHPYAEALGDDLLVLPLPDFGAGSKTGQGSWNWGITAGCPHPEAAGRFLAFLLQTDEVLAMAEANGAVPATAPAIERSPLYRPGGPLHLFVEQLEKTAVPRPATAAYPVITAVFQEAFRDIRDGADVARALAKAAQEIDADLEDNLYYP